MINERKLTKTELNKREDIIMNMKDNKRDLVKKYGKDAEAVMYGRATNMAKKQTKEMRDPKITELIKDALKNPKKADLNKDGKLSDYEETRGAAVEKNLDEGSSSEEKRIVMQAIKRLAKYRNVSDEEAKEDLIRAAKELNSLKEDLDLGHEDNEPSMIKGDLYQIGKASMELYKILDQFDDIGEVDLPSWWQSKIFKAKEAVVGAQEYLDFELNEPRVDAVVDVATDVINNDNVGIVDDVEIDETVEDYITSVDDLDENKLTEAVNMDKWRRAYNGKMFASKIVYLEDYNGNKSRYRIGFKYKETSSQDVVSLSESLFGGHEGSGTSFAISNLQNNPTRLFTSDDVYMWDDGTEFDAFIASGSKGLDEILEFFLGSKRVDNAIMEWFNTGVTDKSKIRIGDAKYNTVNESTSKYSTIAEKLAKELKEGLPKGFWDKKIDAKDENQDGKIDENLDDKLRGALGDKDFEKVINKPVPSLADMIKLKPAKDKK